MVFNFGLHRLQLYPFRNIAGNLQTYSSLLSEAIPRMLLKLKPIADGGIFIYKGTHSVCSQKYNGDYADALADWRLHNGTRFRGKEKCAVDLLKNSALFVNESKETALRLTEAMCDASTMDNVGVAEVERRAHAVLAKVAPHALYLDFAGITRQACSCTGDARHYWPLHFIFWWLVDSCIVE